jgi:hypothetical protein
MQRAKAFLYKQLGDGLTVAVAKMPHNQKFRFLPNICHRKEICCSYRRDARTAR